MCVRMVKLLIVNLKENQDLWSQVQLISFKPIMRCRFFRDYAALLRKILQSETALKGNRQNRGVIIGCVLKPNSQVLGFRVQSSVLGFKTLVLDLKKYVCGFIKKCRLQCYYYFNFTI